MPNDIELSDGSLGLTRSEFVSITISFFIIGIFTAVDVLEDWHSHIPLRHIVPEILIAAFCITSMAYLFLKFARTRSKSMDAVKRELETAKQSAIEWQNQVEKLKGGISEAITGQLNRWGLSGSEQDISFLLIKGLSTKEIAQARNTTEGTIRFQCSAIYKKSGLHSRAQLAAFFLEDLLSN
jgi:DNA-binding CsgD family transcriptional regulator